MTKQTELYHVQFKQRSRATGTFDAGSTREWTVPECADDVIGLIYDEIKSERPVPYDIDRIRVIRMDLNEGRCEDVTHEILMQLGKAEYYGDQGKWPEWLRDIRPAYLD
jgi:hypothetical protein